MQACQCEAVRRMLTEDERHTGAVTIELVELDSSGEPGYLGGEYVLRVAVPAGATWTDEFGERQWSNETMQWLEDSMLLAEAGDGIYEAVPRR